MASQPYVHDRPRTLLTLSLTRPELIWLKFSCLTGGFEYVLHPFCKHAYTC